MKARRRIDPRVRLRTLPVALVACLIAPGCLAPLRTVDPTQDGLAYVLVVNAGPTASVALRDEAGEAAWAARLLEGEEQIVEVAVHVGGCADYRLVAGYNGTEPDATVLFLAPCDDKLDLVRAEFSPPAWYRPPQERGDVNPRSA